MNCPQPLVSVIIPVYNVEAYVGECLDSLLNQTYGNWQAIVINDGSTDKSLEICEKYADNDSRIKVISTTNGGSACARNHGLDNAEGKYVMMVDADDTIPKDSMFTSVCRIEEMKADILASNCMTTTASGRTVIGIRQPEGIYSSYEILELIHSAHMIAGIWSKIYRRDVIAKQRFNPKLRMAQDIFFNTELLLRNPDITVAVTNDITYCYRYRSDSVSHSYSNTKLRPYLEEMTTLIENNAPTCDAKVIGIMSDAIFGMIGYSISKKKFFNRIPDDWERDIMSRLRATIKWPNYIRLANMIQDKDKSNLIIRFSIIRYKRDLKKLYRRFISLTKRLKIFSD